MQRIQSVGGHEPGGRPNDFLECGRKAIVYKKRKSAQCGTLRVVGDREPCLKLEDALDEVQRKEGSHIAHEVVKNVLSAENHLQ